MDRRVCSICLHVIDNTICELTCKHVFHDRCISEWVNIKNQCPLCRCVIKCDRVMFDTVIDEINSISGYNIKKPNVEHMSTDSIQRIVDKLIRIKNDLQEYKRIRDQGYSEDYLATKIGLSVSGIYKDFKILHLNT